MAHPPPFELAYWDDLKQELNQMRATDFFKQITKLGPAIWVNIPKSPSDHGIGPDGRLIAYLFARNPERYEFQEVEAYTYLAGNVLCAQVTTTQSSSASEFFPTNFQRYP